MKALFVRHAESENNAIQGGMSKEEYHLKRTCDPNLSELGFSQTYKVAKFLKAKNLKVRTIYVSPLKRSITTGSVIQNAIGGQMAIITDLHEVGGLYKGPEVFKGNNKEYYETTYPNMKIPADITEKGWWLSEKKETKDEAKLRAARLVKQLKEEIVATPDGSFNIFVSHGAFMDCLMGHLLDRKEDSTQLYLHANTGISRFDFDSNGKHSLIYLNLAEHLEEEFSSIFVHTNSFNIEVEYSPTKSPTKKDFTSTVSTANIAVSETSSDLENKALLNTQEKGIQAQALTISEISQTGDIDVAIDKETQTPKKETTDSSV